jgi:uncharacterized protein YbjQ (UPF0145 family)
VNESDQGGLPSSEHALASGGPAVPAMPVITDHEKFTAPRPLLEAAAGRMIGWHWNTPAKGGPQFVILSRGAMGGLKVVERYPLTEDGWRDAWRSLSRDPAAAERAAARLARRDAELAAAGVEPEYRTPVLIVTTNEVPGHRITQVHGDVFGLIVRARNVFSNFGASLRTISGGEVGGYTKLLVASRNQARERMWGEARARGANAVVAMRFDCNEIGDIMSEIVAYGTAVTVEPASPEPAPAP